MNQFTTEILQGRGRVLPSPHMSAYSRLLGVPFRGRTMPACPPHVGSKLCTGPQRAAAPLFSVVKIDFICFPSHFSIQTYIGTLGVAFHKTAEVWEEEGKGKGDCWAGVLQVELRAGRGG